MQNYRPISLTSIVVKVMETIIAAHLRAFLSNHKIIPSQQHGFMPGRSVITNLLQCVHDWTYAIDRGDPVDVIYLDFSKDFDRGPKNRLLYKLNDVGIRGSLLAWLWVYLSDRVFRVQVGDKLSNFAQVSSGVPQGSVLGPLLFLIYVADIACRIKSQSFFLADDPKLFSNPITK